MCTTVNKEEKCKESKKKKIIEKYMSKEEEPKAGEEISIAFRKVR